MQILLLLLLLLRYLFFVAHLLWKQFCKTWTLHMRNTFECHDTECHCKWLHMFSWIEMNNSKMSIEHWCTKQTNTPKSIFPIAILQCRSRLTLLMLLPLLFRTKRNLHRHSTSSSNTNVADIIHKWIPIPRADSELNTFKNNTQRNLFIANSQVVREKKKAIRYNVMSAINNSSAMGHSSE